MCDLTVTCEPCGAGVDLTSPDVPVVPTIGAGYAFCPACGDILILSADAARRARAARGIPPRPE